MNNQDINVKLNEGGYLFPIKVLEPKEALDLGSHYLVIGRSITRNSNPNGKLEEIIDSL